MTQSLVAGNLKGLGIVPVLFVMGIILIVSKINVDLGQFAIKASVGRLYEKEKGFCGEIEERV